MTDRQGFEGLDSCVHCGFCLQACPTFLATGDEADSPRGRIELMRALEAGELGPNDTGLALHLDRCLGCRGCEPVCPSGVRYGQGLEAARALLTDRRGTPLIVRAALTALTVAGVSGPTGTSHRPSPPPRRMGPGPVRVGNVGRYRAGEQGAGSGSFRRSPSVRSAPTGTAPRSPLP